MKAFGLATSLAFTLAFCVHFFIKIAASFFFPLDLRAALYYPFNPRPRRWDRVPINPENFTHDEARRTMRPWNFVSFIFQSQILLMAGLLIVPQVVWSHAILIDSVPSHDATLDEAPQTILLKFNAALEHVITKVFLIDQNKEETTLEKVEESQADRIKVRVPSLSPGVYTVLYKVLARDGHVTEGSIRFTLRDP